MIKIHILIILLNISAFTFSQTINVATNALTIGMDKGEALRKMNEFIDQSAIESELENYWLINDNQVVGSIGFENEKLSYVTTDWDDEIDYLDSINMFNTLFKVLKSTFGSNYEGDIILHLEEINEPNSEKLGISIQSSDGKSVSIKRENISLEIQQIAKKL
jgi:hypothetical protein